VTGAGPKRLTYEVGPFAMDDVVVFCMQTMVHSSIHVDAGAAREATGGVTVPTPLLVAATFVGAPERLEDLAYECVERSAPARCGEPFTVLLELQPGDGEGPLGCEATLTDRAGAVVMRLRGACRPAPAARGNGAWS
jgi:hypothetical protein